MKSKYNISKGIILNLFQDLYDFIMKFSKPERLLLRALSIYMTFSMISCKKFIEIPAPQTTVNADILFASDATAAAVLTGIYTNMSIENKDQFSGGNGLTLTSLYPSISADELTVDPGTTNAEILEYYTNSLEANVVGSTDFWNKIYHNVFTINSAIDGLNKSSTLTAAVKSQLLGEAYFMRAFCYFHLINLYGDVPLILSTNYKITSIQPKTKKSDVYTQIKDDLINAQKLISEKYLDGTVSQETGERVRPNRFAVTAFLARIYLYTNDYINAEIQASKVINENATFSLNPLNEVFLKNSSETIWALQNVGVENNSNTGEGKLFLLPETGPDGFSHFVYLSSDLITSFESGDQRLVNWVKSINPSGTTYFYANKYKIGAENTPTAEYSVILRLAEQYLIRAEARIQQNNIVEGLADLNKLRTRATDLNAPDVDQLSQLTSSLSKSDALKAVMNERRHEMFTEWGHRWFDLKRTNTINEVMQTVTAVKGGTWDNHSALYPIPLHEILNNPNLVQNLGYK